MNANVLCGVVRGVLSRIVVGGGLICIYRNLFLGA